MKTILFFLILILASFNVSGQLYDSLQRLNIVTQKVYFSVGAKERAVKIGEYVAKAEEYFKKELNIQPQYTVLVLSKADWKKFAHPNAIYGIPHYLPDGRLVVAAENNEFWKRSLPPLETLPKELAEKARTVYTDESGEISLKAFFDLLAIHELGHAFQKAAGMENQRNWMGELLSNMLLHTYVAENEPHLLPALTVFPQLTISAINSSKLKYTTLEDFETHYNEIAQKYPDNYGWYQCRFHTTANQIYTSGGTEAMKRLWVVLLHQKENLTETALKQLLANASPTTHSILVNWDKK